MCHNFLDSFYCHNSFAIFSNFTVQIIIKIYLPLLCLLLWVGSWYAAQAGLELLGLSDPSASAFQVGGTIGVCHHAKLIRHCLCLLCTCLFSSGGDWAQAGRQAGRKTECVLSLCFPAAPHSWAHPFSYLKGTLCLCLRVINLLLLCLCLSLFFFLELFSKFFCFLLVRVASGPCTTRQVLYCSCYTSSSPSLNSFSGETKNLQTPDPVPWTWWQRNLRADWKAVSLSLWLCALCLHSSHS
jgi:hypothetical protein